MAGFMHEVCLNSAIWRVGALLIESHLPNVKLPWNWEESPDCMLDLSGVSSSIFPLREVRSDYFAKSSRGFTVNLHGYVRQLLGRVPSPAISNDVWMGMRPVAPEITDAMVVVKVLLFRKPPSISATVDGTVVWE